MAVARRIHNYDFSCKRCLRLKLEIIRKDKLSEIEQHVLWDGIEDFTQTIVGATGRHELSFLLHNDKAEMVGAVQGNYDNFGWLWIDSLWVSKSVRRKGFGLKLLNKIEATAIENGCKHSHLTSFSYQAADFYIKQGYEIFGELENYSKNHSRYWLKKELT
jgi:ribosomal protein S18 acetylase RimI-like enzyme